MINSDKNLCSIIEQRVTPGVSAWMDHTFEDNQIKAERQLCCGYACVLVPAKRCGNPTFVISFVNCIVFYFEWLL